MGAHDSLLKQGSPRDLVEQLSQELRREIDGLDSDYLLNVGETSTSATIRSMTVLFSSGDPRVAADGSCYKYPGYPAGRTCS